MKSELGIVEAKFMSIKEGVLGVTAYESGCILQQIGWNRGLTLVPMSSNIWHRDESFLCSLREHTLHKSMLNIRFINSEV